MILRRRGSSYSHGRSTSTPELRVIYTSGYSHAVLAERRQASARGPLLSKPFSPDALLAAVSGVLREQRLA